MFKLNLKVRARFKQAPKAMSPEQLCNWAAQAHRDKCHAASAFMVSMLNK
jgi:hypothetical protein